MFLDGLGLYWISIITLFNTDLVVLFLSLVVCEEDQYYAIKNTISPFKPLRGMPSDLHVNCFFCQPAEYQMQTLPLLIYNHWVFLWVVPYFYEPVGQVKVDTTSNQLFFYPTVVFFFCQVFLFISHKAGKAKQIVKCSTCCQLVKQVFFQYRKNNCPWQITVQ